MTLTAITLSSPLLFLVVHCDFNISEKRSVSEHEYHFGNEPHFGNEGAVQWENKYSEYNGTEDLSDDYTGHRYRHESSESPVKRNLIPGSGEDTANSTRSAQLRRFKVEVKGIPSRPDEDLKQIIMRVRELQTVPSPNKILWVERNNNSRLQPQPILVEVADEHDMNRWIRHARIKRYLTANDLDPTFPKLRLFINELLPVDVKKLLFDTKRFAKDQGYMFVWSKNGAVFLRKNTYSNIHRITKFKDCFNLREHIERNYKSKPGLPDGEKDYPSDSYYG